VHEEIVRIVSFCPESRNERSREEKLHTVFRAGDATRMVKASLLQSGVAVEKLLPVKFAKIKLR